MAVPKGFVHQRLCSCQPLRRQIGPVFQHVSHPFFMDGVGPFFLYQPRLCQPDNQVAERSRVEDVDVVDGGTEMIHQ